MLLRDETISSELQRRGRTSAPVGQPWCHREATTTSIQVDPHTRAFLREPPASYPETQFDPPEQAWDKTTGSGYRPLASPNKGSSQITDCNYGGVSFSTPRSFCHRYKTGFSLFWPQARNHKHLEGGNSAESQRGLGRTAAAEQQAQAAFSQARVCSQTARAGHLPHAVAGTAKAGLSSPSAPTQHRRRGRSSPAHARQTHDKEETHGQAWRGRAGAR